VRIELRMPVAELTMLDLCSGHQAVSLFRHRNALCEWVSG
jgi:hypothetical protein